MRASPWVQLRLFEDPVEEPRAPGWQLITDGRWHVVDHTLTGERVATVCGVVGGVVRSNARIAAPCVDCTAVLSA